jgi:hypothetical protein
MPHELKGVKPRHKTLQNNEKPYPPPQTGATQNVNASGAHQAQKRPRQRCRPSRQRQPMTNAIGNLFIQRLSTPTLLTSSLRRAAPFTKFGAGLAWGGPALAAFASPLFIRA